MPLIQIDNPGEAGIITDINAQEIPNNAFSAARNFRFNNKAASKMQGHSAVLGTPTIDPYWLMPLTTNTNDFWIYAGLAKVYVTDGSTHFNLTRQTAGVDVNYNATADQSWNGGVIGGIPVINNGIDDPQMWNPVSTSNRLQSLTWDASNTWADKSWKAACIRVYREYLIALDVTKASVENHRLIAWSTSSVPGDIPSTWDKDITSEDAGETELAQTNGKLIEGLSLGEIFVIYKEDSIWAMQYIGGVNIFRFYQLFSNIGILTRRCVKEFNGMHFVLANGDVVVHDGSTIKSIIEEKRRNELFSNISSDNYQRCFVSPNYIKQEMWVCYPTSGATFPNRAMVWNWTNNSWGDRDLPSATHIGYGVVNDSNETTTWDSDTGIWNDDTTTWNAKNYNPAERKMLMAAGSGLYLPDDTTQFSGSNFTGYVERTGLHFGEPERVKHISEVWLRITGNGSVNVTVGYSNSPNSAVTWTSSQTYTIGTDSKVNVRASGRYIAYKIESTSNDTVNIHGIGFKIKPAGRR